MNTRKGAAPRKPKKRLRARGGRGKAPGVRGKTGELDGLPPGDWFQRQMEALKDAQAEVERARGHYEDLYDFAPVGYISFDGTGLIREVNLTAASLLEQTRTNLLRTPFAVFIARESVATFMTHLGRCRRGESRVASEILLKPGSRKLVPVQILSNPVASGTETLYRTVFTDLTERKRGEEELRDAHKELERRIYERTMELQKANEELEGEIKTRRRLEGEILEISDREQRRMGQDLHDGLCQHLAALSLMAKAIATRLRREKQSEAEEIDQVSALLTDAVGQTRALARGLHPVEVDSNGLMSALQELASSANGTMVTRFECSRPVAIEDNALALNLYRIAQEALGNAVKHSRGKRIDIQLASRRGEIVLRVQDDGAGIPRSPARSQGMGIHIMNYRARIIGASLKVASRRKGGTCVACSIPAPKP